MFFIIIVLCVGEFVMLKVFEKGEIDIKYKNDEIYRGMKEIK